jgi:hypothetical protein
MNATGRNTAISDSVVASTAADLLGRFDRRRIGDIFFVDVAVDVLEHHDRVVDHDADRERERQQRQHVQREPGDHHETERRDDRHRDRDGRDDRRAQAAEEEQHDERCE